MLPPRPRQLLFFSDLILSKEKRVFEKDGGPLAKEPPHPTRDTVPTVTTVPNPTEDPLGARAACQYHTPFITATCTLPAVFRSTPYRTSIRRNWSSDVR